MHLTCIGLLDLNKILESEQPNSLGFFLNDQIQCSYTLRNAQISHDFVCTISHVQTLKEETKENEICSQ